MKKNFRYFFTLLPFTAFWALLFTATDQAAVWSPSVRKLKNTLTHIYRRDGIQILSRKLAITEDTTPCIPRQISAVIGEPISIYYSNLVLSKDPDKFLIEISSDTLKGSSERRRWTLVPSELDKGTHSLLISVKNWSGETLETKTIEIKVASPTSPDDEVSVLLLGNSITAQNTYPNALYKKLNTRLEGKIRFVGSVHSSDLVQVKGHYSRPPLPEVYHEGYPGWTWKRFLTFKPIPEDSSPFVFKKNEKATLNIERYLEEQNLKNKLNYVIFFLGSTELTLMNPDDPESSDHKVKTILKSADKLILAFQKATPSTKVEVVLPPPFTSSRRALYKAFHKLGPEYLDSWRHRRAHHNLTVSMIDHFEKNHPSVTLIPLNACFDTIDGYTPSDPLHPNNEGGEQAASIIYSHILSETGKNAPN